MWPSAARPSSLPNCRWHRDIRLRAIFPARACRVKDRSASTRVDAYRPSPPRTADPAVGHVVDWRMVVAEATCPRCGRSYSLEEDPGVHRCSGAQPLPPNTATRIPATSEAQHRASGLVTRLLKEAQTGIQRADGVSCPITEEEALSGVLLFLERAIVLGVHGAVELVPSQYEHAPSLWWNADSHLSVRMAGTPLLRATAAAASRFSFLAMQSDVSPPGWNARQEACHILLQHPQLASFVPIPEQVQWAEYFDAAYGLRLVPEAWNTLTAGSATGHARVRSTANEWAADACKQIKRYFRRTLEPFDRLTRWYFEADNMASVLGRACNAGRLITLALAIEQGSGPSVERQPDATIERWEEVVSSKLGTLPHGMQDFTDADTLRMPEDNHLRVALARVHRHFIGWDQYMGVHNTAVAGHWLPDLAIDYGWVIGNLELEAAKTL